MPMLAEPKKKRKITLNPRGTLWSKDENKFGQKLLEKMGWSKGKGLGKEGQGIKDPIHISANSDSKGMGFKGNPDLSTQHYQDFEDVLSSLNSANNSESSNSEPEKDSDNLKNVESLEMKSKKSRARVHYSKFTRGKDLSRYNADDLACVLGSKKASNDKAGKSQNEENNTEPEEEKTNKKDSFTYYSGNLKDYFNEKMADLKRKRGEGLLGDEHTPSRSKMFCNSTPGTPFPDLEFEPAKTNFSFNLSVQEHNGSPEVEEEEEGTDIKKEIDCEGNEMTEKKKKHKKSKKSKDKEVERNYECFEEMEKVDNEFKENIDEKKPKKSKRKCRDVDAEGNHSPKNESKKKKKRKNKEEEESMSVSSKSEESLTQNNSELNIKQETQSTNCHMNESYVKATSRKSKKQKESDQDTLEDEENKSVSKPFKKLKKLASEVSLPEILKSSSEKIDNENNANCEVENDAAANDKTEEEVKPTKVKLKSKRSFKELKSEFEAKVKEKIKKKSKTELITIEEEQEATLEKKTTKKSDRNSTVLNIDVPIASKNPDAPKQFRSIQFDVEKTFPGSNLHKIEGYFKNKNK